MADVWRQKLGTGERWTEEDGRAALAAWEASGGPWLSVLGRRPRSWRIGPSWRRSRFVRRG